MSVILGMLMKKEASFCERIAEDAESFFLKASASLGAEHLEKVAVRFRGFGAIRKTGDDNIEESLLSADNPLLAELRSYMRDHPPEGMDQLRDMYVQVTQRALQKALTKLETSDDVDPMGTAVKNLNRMAEMLQARLDVARSQRELQEYQKDMAAKQGVGATPAGAATAQLPLAAAPPPLPPAPMPGPMPGGPGPGPGVPPPPGPPMGGLGGLGGPGGPGGPGIPPPPG